MGRIVFPKAQASMRRRNMRFFFLSIALGLMFCMLFGCVLFFLNRQGRI